MCSLYVVATPPLLVRAPCEVGSLDALALDGHRLHAGAALRINVSAPQSLSVMHNEYQVTLSN